MEKLVTGSLALGMGTPLFCEVLVGDVFGVSSVTPGAAARHHGGFGDGGTTAAATEAVAATESEATASGTGEGCGDTRGGQKVNYEELRSARISSYV